MIAPLRVKHSTDVNVLYVSYGEGTISHTEAVDADGEILADIGIDGRVIGIECLCIDGDLRSALQTYAVKHDLLIPPEVDAFRRSFA